MKSFLCALALIVATPCFGQQAVPSWDVYAGYSFERANVRHYFKSTPTLYAIRDQAANLHGLELSVTENSSRWFGGTVNLSIHANSPEMRGTTNHERIVSIMYGPRFSYRTPSFVPFAQVLAGATHADVKVTQPGPHASDWSFGTGVGGGLDLTIGSKAAIRLIQADYIRTGALGSGRNNYRASLGIVFYVGRR